MLKKQLTIYLFVLLLGGLFWSRALLSITILIWALLSLFQTIKTNKSFFKNSFFIWSVTPLILWILGAWTIPFDKTNLDYLLTLSSYPAIVMITNATPFNLVQKKWIKIWLGATAIALTYPLYWYFMDFTAAHKAYGTGQSLPTFMDTDHVRFSIFLCSSLLFLLFTSIIKQKYQRIFGGILLILILFLSVRTGWVIAISLLCYYAAHCYFQTKEKN